MGREFETAIIGGFGGLSALVETNPVQWLRVYNSAPMNPRPAPHVPGSTEWERFDNAVRKVFSVPIEAIQREKERIEKLKAKRKRAKKKS